MDGESDMSVCQCVCQSCCGHCVVSGEWTVSRTGPSVSVCVSRAVATVWCPVNGRLSRTGPSVSVCVSRSVTTVWCPVNGR